KGPVQSAMLAALRERDWQATIQASRKIVDVFPQDTLAKVILAVSLDATGQHAEAEAFSDSMIGIGKHYLWVALEFARSKIRRRDFLQAERILDELSQQFRSEVSIDITRARLFEAMGDNDQAVATCGRVLSDAACRERDAFYAGLVL